MEKSFTIAMKDFFGYRAGKGMADFQAELKALSHEDKLYFHAELEKVGIACLAPVKAA